MEFVEKNDYIIEKGGLENRAESQIAFFTISKSEKTVKPVNSKSQPKTFLGHQNNYSSAVFGEVRLDGGLVCKTCWKKRGFSWGLVPYPGRNIIGVGSSVG